MPAKPPLEGCVQAYWLMARDLRLIRAAGGDDRAEIVEILDLAYFTDHPGLRRACLSQIASTTAFPDIVGTWGIPLSDGGAA